MRETRQSGSVGGGPQANAAFLPQSVNNRYAMQTKRRVRDFPLTLTSTRVREYTQYSISSAQSCNAPKIP
ncbi:MAG: hypothetical protein KDA92_20260, partial [Planctomycetales bacterium]|nr:hypothetical protein [Planctomycetales bacterium]